MQIKIYDITPTKFYDIKKRGKKPRLKLPIKQSVLRFIHEDIKGEFEIIDSFCEKGSSKVKILYNNKPFIIACNHLREGKIGRIIGKVTIEFKLNKEDK